MKTIDDLLKECEHDGSFIPVGEVRRLMKEYATELLKREYKSIGSEQKKKLIAEIDDTSAFGIPHHEHSKHRVSVVGLTHEQAKMMKGFIDNTILLMINEGYYK